MKNIDDKTYLVTEEWIVAFSTSELVGSWTRAQIEALGVKWPPRRGWKWSVIDTKISERQRLLFEHGRDMIHPKTVKSRHKRHMRSVREKNSLFAVTE